MTPSESMHQIIIHLLSIQGTLGEEEERGGGSFIQRFGGAEGTVQIQDVWQVTRDPLL